jgi:hypothetical protein
VDHAMRDDDDVGRRECFIAPSQDATKRVGVKVGLACRRPMLLVRDAACGVAHAYMPLCAEKLDEPVREHRESAIVPGEHGKLYRRGARVERNDVPRHSAAVA